MTYLQIILLACAIFAFVYQTVKLIEFHALASSGRGVSFVGGWTTLVIFLPCSAYFFFIISLTGVKR